MRAMPTVVTRLPVPAPAGAPAASSNGTAGIGTPS